MDTPFGAVRTLEAIGVSFTVEQLEQVRAYCKAKNDEDATAMKRWWNGSLNMGTCTIAGQNAGPSKRQQENAKAFQTGKMLARNEMLEQLKRAGVPEHLWASIVR